MKKFHFFFLVSFGLGLFQAGGTPVPYDSGGDADTFRVATVLQSNMVVQQAKPFRIWGTAPSGDQVRVSASWTDAPVSAIADAGGKWLATVPVPEAIPGDFTAHQMRIVHGRDTVELENILIGEVWMCSGQSNMTFMLDSIPGWGPGVPGHDREVAAADYPYIRLMGVGMALEDRPVEEVKGTWKVCSPETIGSFSAVAYFFGRKLFQTLNVPIGLVANGIPGAGEQSFTSLDVLGADTALERKYLLPYRDKPRNDKEYILATLQRPGLIYNGMIHPIRHLSLAGVIWYQGESNRLDGPLYTHLSKAMLAGWRKDFDQGPLPFYFVQMPSYTWGEEPGSSSYALFREAQEAILEVENTGMIVTMDVGEPDDLHPRNKKPVGERLARLALRKSYGMDIRYEGPRFTGFEKSANLVKVSFDNTGGELKTSDGRSPSCFYLAGADRVFHPAAATLHGNQVWLRSEEVPVPVAVRFAFTNASLTNLSGSEGLPAAPFRTDDWDKARTIAAPAFSLRLAPLLQNGMVVQQDGPFRFWGTAAPGDTILLSASWAPEARTTTVAGRDGRWEGQLSVPPAVPGDFKPQTARVICRSDTLYLSDLLIGDVWLCAGQSNMDMTVQKIEGWYPGVLNYEQEVAEANYPAIRLLKIGAAFELEPQETAQGTWKVCSPETAGGFSAVAYFFGRDLFRELNIPVGLVVAAAAGASGQAFTPRKVLEADPQLKRDYLDPYRADLVSQEHVDTIGFFTKVTRPVLIYNGMIHPLEKLSLRGFIWYQGESNHNEREGYTRLCTAMLKSWRERFGHDQLPFYFTQIAPFDDKYDPTGAKTAFFREAQEAILEVENTGMAVIMDVGEAENVHPRDKKPVGQRLAAQALRYTYGQDVPADGPAFSAMKTRGRKVRLSFRAVGGGLETKDGKAPRQFFLAGADQVFHPAAARIRGRYIWLESEDVKRPVAVRYAFSNAAITNLQNKEGFPALPFRTDSWEK